MMTNNFWMIMYQNVLRLYRSNDYDITLTYYFIAICFMQILVVIYSLVISYQKISKWSLKSINLSQKMILLFLILLMTSGNFLLAFSKSNMLKGIGYIFALSPSIVYINSLIILVIPSILRNYTQEIQEEKSVIYSVNSTMIFNMFGIMATLMVLIDDLVIVNMVTMGLNLIAGFFLFKQIDVPENFNQNIVSFKKMFNYFPNVRLFRKFTLIIFTLVALTSIIISWNGNYHNIVASRLELSLDNSEVVEIVEYFTNFWVWSGPIFILSTIKLLTHFLKHNFLYELFTIMASISLISIIIGTRTSLILFGFSNSTLSILYFSANIETFCKQFVGGVLVQAIIISIAGLINLASDLKTDIYKNPDRILTLVIIEGTISILLGITLIEWKGKKNKKQEAEEEEEQTEEPEELEELQETEQQHETEIKTSVI